MEEREIGQRRAQRDRWREESETGRGGRGETIIYCVNDLVVAEIAI